MHINKKKLNLYFPIPILVLTVILIEFFLFVSGYYQPAGPLINSHLVPQSQPVSTKAGSSGLDGETVQLQSPSTTGSESTDREVLITGKTK